MDTPIYDAVMAENNIQPIIDRDRWTLEACKARAEENMREEGWKPQPKLAALMRDDAGRFTKKS